MSGRHETLPALIPAAEQALPVAAITIPAHRLRQLQSEIVADLTASIASAPDTGDEAQLKSAPFAGAWRKH
jgi:hypothetical protein